MIKAAQTSVYFLLLSLASIYLCVSLIQIRRISENDCLGFDVTNNGRDTLVIEKDSQPVAYLSIWATVKEQDDEFDRY